MTIMSFAAAGFAAFAVLAPIAIAAPAAAQQHHVVQHHVVRHTTQTARGHRAARQVCTNVMRNHHRVRSCRTVYR
jgi:3-deoxy-D-manno-octulosonate 8-phosphate phosphatase KdsC-like HAD superfamily phosphatase